MQYVKYNIYSVLSLDSTSKRNGLDNLTGHD